MLEVIEPYSARKNITYRTQGDCDTGRTHTGSVWEGYSSAAQSRLQL
jgi:hypothetical protein